MLCPKCKKEIKDNSLKCEYCGTKIGSICTECGSYNKITEKKCITCGKILIKICENCGAANYPHSKSCRKCGINFKNDNEGYDFKNVNYTQSNTQQKVKSKLIDAINNDNCKIITISGESGCGKNLVLNSVINEFKNKNILWLYGNCSQVSQLSPFGYFQNLLLMFFNINNFCPDTLQLKRNSLKIFKQDFPTLTNNEILDLLNLLYPDNLDKYENIYYNRNKTQDLIKKVILTIVEKIDTVFVIDNMEFIDGMSYGFIKELLLNDTIVQKCKFVFLQKEFKPGLGLISAPKLAKTDYVDLSISPFSLPQIETFVKQQNIIASRDYINQISKISKGNPAIVEQIALLENDFKKNGIRNIEFDSIDKVIELRLNILKEEDYNAYKILTALSVLGKYFYPAMLENFNNNFSQKEFERIIHKLIDIGFITPVSNLSCEFKSSDIWKIIVSIVKNDDSFEEILNTIYEIIGIYKQSSIALLGYILQKLNNNDKAFEVWTLLMKQASYIGDISLYIIVQKQALKLIENKTSNFYLTVKKNINTRIGKLLEPIDHKEAFKYLEKNQAIIKNGNQIETDNSLKFELIYTIVTYSSSDEFILSIGKGKSISKI